MGDYIDNVVLKLKRKYSKDELVASMIKEQSQLNFELGVVKSERDELQHTLDRFLKIDNNTKSRFCQIQYVREMRKEIKDLHEKCKKLKNENTKLFSDLVKHNALKKNTWHQ